MDTESYAREYISFMKEVNENNHVLNVSTITLICNLNVDNVSIQTFSENFKSNHGIVMKVQSAIRDGRLDVTRRSKVKRAFFNQITLNYKDISNKSIKIFSNGKLQITGLTSVYECQALSDYVLRILQETLQDTTIEITDRYIGMINSNFSTKTNLDLMKLNRILNRNGNVMSIYNPESYPAINMKFQMEQNCTSIFIFGTGNIVTTGGKNLRDIRMSYQFIHKTIMDNYEEVCRNTEFTIKTKDPEPLIHGYSIRQYMSCVY